mgnify:CR=1 FL=1
MAFSFSRSFATWTLSVLSSIKILFSHKDSIRSGFDLCMQLRRQTEVPVIFLTGRADPMDELNGLLKGGDDYILKHIHSLMLKQKMQYLHFILCQINIPLSAGKRASGYIQLHLSAGGQTVPGDDPLFQQILY